MRFWYESHEEGKRIEEVLPVLEFIGKLVRHIPDKQFKMVRYYGIYSRNRKSKAKKVMSVWQKYRQTIYKRINWRKSIQKSFGYDPLICPKCGKEMILKDIVYKKYGSMLERMQEKMWEAYKREGEKLLKEYVS